MYILNNLKVICLIFLSCLIVQYSRAANLATSQNKFSRDLYSLISSEKDGNIFFSPFGIYAAMSMVYMGAEENTKKEIQSVLNFSEDKLQLQDALSDAFTKIQREQLGYKLNSANAAYISQLLNLSPVYASVLQTMFNSSAKSVDFNKAEVVRNEINDYVKMQTNNKILDLLPPDSIDPMTMMVLVNTVYFLGNWKSPFDSLLTKNKKFWISKGNSVDVPMMTDISTSYYKYRQDLNCSIIGLDYIGGETQFWIVLPNDRTNLTNVEEALKSEDFEKLDEGLGLRKLQITMPKFNLTHSIKMAPVMKKMGIVDLFDLNANLSGIADNKPLFVGDIFHKSSIDVNEKGSESSSATGTTIMTLSAPTRVTMNKPFMFFIRHSPTKFVLFAGRVTNPLHDDNMGKNAPKLTSSDDPSSEEESTSNTWIYVLVAVLVGGLLVAAGIFAYRKYGSGYMRTST